MAVAGLIVGAASAAAVVWSVWYLAQQTKISAGLTATTVLTNAMVMIDAVVAQFLEYPELRKYFYDGAELSADESPGEITRARVETLAELFADAFEMALESLSRIPGASGDFEDVTRSAREMLSMSPALQTSVRRYEWWPRMSQLEKTRNVVT